MEILGKLKQFFDHPTKARMNAVCITGIICTAVCLINWIFSLGSSLFFYWEHWMYWEYFFRELLKTNLPNLFLLIALLLSFCHWQRGKNFRFCLAVPLILMYTFSVSIYNFISTWLIPGSSFVGNPVLIILSFLVSLFMMICLIFLILAVARSSSHHIALLTLIPIILNLLFVLVNWILYDLIPQPANVLSVFPLIMERMAWLLFCAGWYMRQKESTE